MSLNDTPKANPSIVFREEGEDALLFDPDTGKVKVLNETGKLIWSNLDGKNDKDSLVKKIMNAFEITDEAKIKEDVEKFLEELEKLKFLE